MRRYPSSSAQRTAFTHSGPLGICQTPRPSMGIWLPSARMRARPSALTALAVIDGRSFAPGLQGVLLSDGRLLRCTATVSAGAGRVRHGTARRLEPFEDEPHCHRAFPDRGRGALDGAAADVADGEDPRPAGFQEQRHPAGVVKPTFRYGAAGEQETAGVLGKLAREPLGAGLGPDEDEQAPDG